MANRYVRAPLMLATCASLALALLTPPGAAAAGAPTLLLTTEHSPPSSMRGADGQVTGRETDKVREMLARASVDYKLDLLPWKRAYTMALTQSATCVYATSRTPEREPLFKWVGPTDEADWMFWGRADHHFALKTLDDARRLRIGTYHGDARDEYLRSRGFQVESVNNDQANPHKVLMNRIDLWAVAIRVGAQMPTYEWSGKVVPLLVFNRVKVYLACNLSVPDDLVARLNATLDEMRRDGSMARIERQYEHWELPPKP